MMTPRVTNNDINLHDEEFNGQEVEAAALPPPTEMAANRREEADEPDDDETEEPSGRTNRRYRFRFSRNQALAALAALAVVGTATVISRAASGKTSSISSSMQQAAVVQQEVPGYTNFGVGYCQDASNAYYTRIRHFLSVGANTAQDCADKCECVKNDVTVSYRGFAHQPTNSRECDCFVDNTSKDVLSAVSDQCEPDELSGGPGTGEIKGIDTGINFNDYSCYKVGGGGSKAGKAPKAPKRG